ncbi:DUF1203 domain-containing protein [Flexibacterium corallicola]|uniref:DUF1203 domain-containing protein n=1 Tax=Flexibacterium corallicola TaxID=3037259 RepID=UPI00286F6693|nr:DUF1203 domain-containing protein [Pseudovibrio sp. M1P-2-3]
MPFIFNALPTKNVRELQSGGYDANGQLPEKIISDGEGNPCRHCLKNIPEGQGILIAAYRPFKNIQAFAETGPIFLCEDACERSEETTDLPEIFQGVERILIRGYCEEERIVYGTGAVVPMVELEQGLAKIFKNPKVTSVHMRSATNNCYQAKVTRS